MLPTRHLGGNEKKTIIPCLKRPISNQEIGFGKTPTPSSSIKTKHRQVRGSTVFARKAKCSKSLTDLSHDQLTSPARKMYAGSLRGDKLGSPATTRLAPPKIDQLTETSGLDDRNSTDATTVGGAARRVQSTLMLHAWRRRRHENMLLHQTIAALETAKEGLEMQNFVLRQLLDKEKERVKEAGSQLQEMAEILQAKDTVLMEVIKDQDDKGNLVLKLEADKRKLQLKLANAKNELETVKSDARNWEIQLNKEREMVTKLEEESRELSENMVLCEAELRHLKEDIKKEKDGRVVQGGMSDSVVRRYRWWRAHVAAAAKSTLPRLGLQILAIWMQPFPLRH